MGKRRHSIYIIIILIFSISVGAFAQPGGVQFWQWIPYILDHFNNKLVYRNQASAWGIDENGDIVVLPQLWSEELGLWEINESGDLCMSTNTTFDFLWVTNSSGSIILRY